jgi:hypothetical protein
MFAVSHEEKSPAAMLGIYFGTFKVLTRFYIQYLPS